ncbi:MAG TPA: AI-2E family transporter [Verrucomicrobiae bacterium]|jgi:predicted PurR-regulated permease PerM
MQTQIEPREEEAVAEPLSEAFVEKVEDTPHISDLAIFLKRTRAAVPVAVIGLFLLGTVAFLYFAKPFVMPIVLAMFLSFLLKPMVRGLTKLRIPEIVGAVLVIAVSFTVVSLSVTKLVQPATHWIAMAPETLEHARERFHMIVRRVERLSRAAARMEDMAHPTASETTPQVEVHPQPVLVNTVLTYTRTFVAGTIETVVLLFFMLAAGDMFLQKLVKVMPTLHDKKKAVGIATEVQQSISTFLFTITAINTALGVIVGFAALLVGMPNPVLWGVLAGVLNFIPYFGPITGVVVLLIAGFMTFESPLRALTPSLIYLCLHGVESNLVTPVILGRRLTLNPLVIFISLMFWTWLWGIPGALLSIPMLMMAKILCDHFKPLAPVGEFMSG